MSELTERVAAALGPAAETGLEIAGGIAHDLGESPEAWRGVLILAVTLREFLGGRTAWEHPARANAAAAAILALIVDTPEARAAMTAIEAMEAEA